MQITNNLSNNLKKPWIIGLVKLILLLGCLYFIALKVREQPVSIHTIEFQYDTYLAIMIVFILMPFNWLLEAYRWKLSVGQFEEISLRNALEVVISGLALNWILPFTSGDFIVRIAGQKDKYKSTAAVVLNRGIMMTFTLVLGLYGISFIAEELKWNVWLIPIAVLGLIIPGIVFKKSINQFLSFFGQLSIELLFRLVFFSTLRYFIFVLQFYLLLQAFLPQLEPQLLIAGIGWIFFARSVFPMFLGGAGVREVSGIFFYQSYTDELVSVIIPIFLIWVINSVIPTMAGLIVMLRAKHSRYSFSANSIN